MWGCRGHGAGTVGTCLGVAENPKSEGAVGGGRGWQWKKAEVIGGQSSS